MAAANPDWFAAHVAQVQALYEWRFGKENMLQWRTSFMLEDMMVSVVIARLQGQGSTCTLTRLGGNAILSGPDMHPADIVAFLGLASVDPETVAWTQRKESELLVVRGGMPGLDVQRRMN